MNDKAPLSKKESIRIARAAQQRELLELPLEKNTILFFDNAAHPISGDLRALLEHCLSDEAFEDYTFIWVARSISEISTWLIDGFGTGRLKVVAVGACGFQKALATSETIITTQIMPQYFVKRAGQFVVYLPNEDAYRRKRLAVRDFIRGAMPQMNLTDVIVVSNEDLLEDLLSLRSPACKNPLSSVVCPHPRRSLDPAQSVSPRAIIALSEKGFNRRWNEAPDAFFSWANEVAHILQIDQTELLVFVPGSAMAWIRDGYVSSNVKIAQFVEGLYPHLPTAQVLITNDLPTMCSSREAGVPCVLITDYNTEAWVNSEKSYPFFSAKCITTRTLDEALDEAASVLKEVKDDNRVIAEENSCKQVAQTILERLRHLDDGVDARDKGDNLDLLCLQWLDNKGVHAFVKRGLNSVSATTLLMADKGYRIVTDERDSFVNACVTYRTGYHLGSEEERREISENFNALKESLSEDQGGFIEMEWRRVLGDVWFDTVYAPKKGGKFWKLMFAFAPADNVVYYDKLSEIPDYQE